MRRSIPLLLLVAVAGCDENGDVGILAPPPEVCPRSSAVAPGVGGVSDPTVIPATKIAPEYPDEARVARIVGDVTLQLVVDVDGTVCGIEIVSEEPGGWGFGAASVAAVAQWRYDPASSNGRPVAVLFTVFVEFTLQ